MSFRTRISIVIFLVGLIPTLAVLSFSAYILSSTLKRVGAAGLETSLQAADTLVDQTQETLGRLLAARLPDHFHQWNSPDKMEAWLKANGVDLAFWVGMDHLALVTSDSVPQQYFTFRSLIQEFEPLTFGQTRVSRLEIGEKSLLLVCKKDTMFRGGCGILMPAGYGRKGMELANSISASASLGIYKTFSIKLLAIATLLAVGLSILLGFFLSSIISRQLAKPLKKLNEGAGIIGAGNLEYKVHLGGSDEFSHLADSFNKMAGEIKNNQRRLLESERLAAWREVARRIAHEIKNPLTPINIQLYRLEEQLQNDQKGQTDNKASRALETIRSQIIALQDLAQHFSTFAKEPELKRAPSSINDLIKQSIDSFSSIEGVEIASNIADNIPQINLDFQMMKRVFVNLIKNSIEAKADHVRVMITAEYNDECINITVRDNGPGLPPEKLQRIEQPYITSKPTGTGLGLVIVKKIVEEHGGQIRFYNDNGAVVDIFLPK